MGVRRFFYNLARRALARWVLPLWYDTPFIYGDPERITFGEKVSKANTLFNVRSGKVTVGNGVMFSHNVLVLTGYHDMNVDGSLMRRQTITDAGRDIVIEAGVWVGGGVIILGPVRIGKNAVIGAGSVVVNDIPPDVLAVGIPAKPIKKLR